MQAQGTIIRHTNIAYRSQPLIMDTDITTQNSTVSSISWQYKASDPVPPGMAVRLCQDQRCIDLATTSGTYYAVDGFSMSNPFYFIYQISGSTPLPKPIYIVSNSIVINYVFPTR